MLPLIVSVLCFIITISNAEKWNAMEILRDLPKNYKKNALNNYKQQLHENEEMVSVTNITFGNKLIVWLYTDSIVRITSLPDKILSSPNGTSRIVTYQPEAVQYTTSNPDSSTTLIKTSSLAISVNTDTYIVTFYDLNDMSSALLTESNKTFISITDTGLAAPTYTVVQEWEISSSTKGIYGWGEYQNGFINYITSTVRCVPFNTEACVPMLITNANYGIYWDNLGVSTLNSLNTLMPNNSITIKSGITDNYAPEIFIPEDKLDTWVKIEAEQWFNLTIPFTANDVPGNRALFSEFNTAFEWGAPKSGLGYIELIIERSGGVREAWDIWNYSNNVPASVAMKPFYMSANEAVTLYINYGGFTQLPKIYYNEPSNNIDIRSEEAFYIDYYFIYSTPVMYQSISPVNQSSLDGIIAGYRLLTEDAPLYELSCYGFWQCKQRYHTESEVLSDALEYRSRELPVDGIVQDWHYWGANENWGPEWDPAQYPDPEGMIEELHNNNFYFMVSVWSKFGLNATCLAYLLSQGNLTNNSELIASQYHSSMPYFDPYNVQAQIDYYSCIKKTMFDYGVDAIWSDATEPEGYPEKDSTYDNGKYSGNALFSPFSFQVSQAIQIGLNIDQPNKRPFDLTRSSFAGQSRTGGAIWSGDTTSTWDTLRRQISASIAFQLAGNPYWSQDIGGFFRPSCNYDCWWFKQLLIRWFQYGAFVPIFRVHGNGVNTAYWNYGPVVLEYVHLIDNLRYRLLPYTYSLAYYVTKYGYTLQRGLMLDFSDDLNIYSEEYQYSYMWGPYMLVSPVFKYDNTTSIYLPSKYNIWYDFWNGIQINGGTTLNNITVALNQIPLHVHQGSIIIMGPYSQWANQYYPWNELEVRIYAGYNAEFIYFNDNGRDRFSLKNNLYTTINFTWIDNKKQLIIGNRQGTYQEMVTGITINCVIVKEGHGIGVNITETPDKSIKYTGNQIIVNF